MKKKPKNKTKVYRGVLIEINGPYSLGIFKVVVHTPDIERYFKSTAGVRSFIDSFLRTHKKPDNGITF